MRFSYQFVLLALVATLIAGCPCPPPPMLTLAGSDADLVGEWEGVRIMNGMNDVTVRATFTDGKTYNIAIGDDTLEGEWAVDMGQMPNAIDFGTTCSNFIDASALRLGVGRYEFVDANSIQFNTSSASSVSAAPSERPDIVETSDIGYFSLTRIQ